MMHQYTNQTVSLKSYNNILLVEQHLFLFTASKISLVPKIRLALTVLSTSRVSRHPVISANQTNNGTNWTIFGQPFQIMNTLLQQA